MRTARPTRSAQWSYHDLTPLSGWWRRTRQRPRWRQGCGQIGRTAGEGKKSSRVAAGVRRLKLITEISLSFALIATACANASERVSLPPVLSRLGYEQIELRRTGGNHLFLDRK